jgi:hypothetical protein
MQLVTTLRKSLYDTMSSQSVTDFNSCCLVTDVNNDYSSSSVLKSRTELLSTEFSHSQTSYFTLRRPTELDHQNQIQSKSYFTMAVYRQLVLLGAKSLETHRQFFFNWTLAFIVWREDGSVVYNCCWPSPTQSFSGPSPAELMTIFYCLRF